MNQKPRVLCASSDGKRLLELTKSLGTSVEVEVAMTEAQVFSRLGRAPDFRVLLATSEVGTLAFSRTCRQHHPQLSLVILAPADEARSRHDPNVFAVLDDATSTGDLVTTVVIAAEQEVLPAADPPHSPKETAMLAMTAELARELEIAALADEAEKAPVAAHTLAAAKALAKLFRLIDGDEYRRSLRYSRHVALILRASKCRPLWPAECAALVRQLGRVCLPTALLDKLDRRSPLIGTEVGAAARIPGITRGIIEHLPGAGDVIEVLEQLDCRYDGRTVAGPHRRAGERISGGARALRLAIDYDQAQARGLSHEEVMKALRADAGRYDPRMLSAVDEIETPPPPVEAGAVVVRSAELTVGAVLAEPLRGVDGNVIFGDSHTITERDVARIRAFAHEHRVRDTVLVLR